MDQKYIDTIDAVIEGKSKEIYRSYSRLNLAKESKRLAKLLSKRVELMNLSGTCINERIINSIDLVIETIGGYVYRNPEEYSPAANFMEILLAREKFEMRKVSDATTEMKKTGVDPHAPYDPATRHVPRAYDHPIPGEVSNIESVGQCNQNYCKNIP